jgi:hypothetical protein
MVVQITSNQAFFIDTVLLQLYQKMNSRITNAAIYMIWYMVHSEFS